MSTFNPEALRTLAAAADKGGEHIYTHWRDSNAAKANEAWHRAVSPELVTGLLDRIAELEAQQERKPLAEEQIEELFRESDLECMSSDDLEAATDFARALERAHGIQEKPNGPSN